MAYGGDDREVPRRLAVYLDKILKGVPDLAAELARRRVDLILAPGTEARCDQGDPRGGDGAITTGTTRVSGEAIARPTPRGRVTRPLGIRALGCSSSPP